MTALAHMLGDRPQCDACGGLHDTAAHWDAGLALQEVLRALDAGDVNQARLWARVVQKCLAKGGVNGTR